MPDHDGVTLPHALTVGADRTLRAGTTRRRFLTWSAVVAGIAMTPQLCPGTASAEGSADLFAPAPRDNPFRLGVASGDPLPDGIVLWTRLATDPTAPRGGMTPGSVAVRWELATDPRFTSIVRNGQELATELDGWSVHVDVRGLDPARDYFYRFIAGPHRSTVGRTRTAPRLGAPLSSLSFAWTSCQRWDQGLFTAWADLAQAAPDVVFFLGDYIYEYPIPATGPRAGQPRPESVTHEQMSLEDYRDRYALYKSDPNLAAAHASSPFISAFDDHEVENNWAGQISEDDVDPRVFLARRANAFKAWWENTPVRANLRPVGPDLNAYRRFTFGDLVDFSVLDTRQYRSDQADGDGVHKQDAVTADPARTITGAAQEKWILDGFTSRSRWKFLAHQTVISDLARTTGGERKVDVDQWGGYEASRHRILDGARERGVSNLASIVGDIHRTVVSELKRDYVDTSAPVQGVEISATSISSAGDGADVDSQGKAIAAASPHVKFGNARRGYARATLSPTNWRTEIRVTDSVSTPNSPMRTAATITVPVDRPEINVS
ncbi:alkaline phosphatase [Williamsia sp. CHRR-6]|uniref:alkaline phosphatase D family protein n=1 Tax=Williamsia sp. CHRR-6 TaxID=2835871 RepID=UPI001BD984EF|nr:alkaline phosphatase D family protein [Williamsia sp. CHRR-6]MBT0565870.1 alkaline phosphatase D family protein [Williamsia sp. CHRR-6]